jgi:hypothetical protein
MSSHNTTVEENFLAVIAGADPSIVRLKLPDGYRWETPGWLTAVGFLRSIHRRMEESLRFLPKPSNDILGQPWDRQNDGAAFMRLREWVPNAAFGQVTSDDSTPAMVWVRTEPVPTKQEPLYRFFDLLRLFKEGTVGIVRFYQWEGGVTGTTSLGSGGPTPLGEGGRYTVTDEEAPVIQRFVDENLGRKFPPAIRLAWTQLETSYQLADPGLALMSSVTGLESILVQSNIQVSYQFSRNLAALLATNRDEFSQLFREAKKLYGIRSTFAHSGERKGVAEAVVLRSRYFLRETIKRAWVDGWDKRVFLDNLNASGF